MSDKIFGFFKFYYYIITRNDKRFEYAVDNGANILLTPLLFFALHMVFGMAIDMVTGGFVGVLTLPIHIPIVPLNLIIQNHYSNMYFKIERQKREERAREERIKRAKELWEDMLKEAEKERKRREEQQRQYYQYQQQQRQQSRDSFRSQITESLRVLGLDTTATKKDVKNRYRELSKKHHPDLGGNQEEFIKINKAYKHIMDNI